ncbi:MAG: carboxypeptidase-like regulatory domain-containing protein, partial [Phycisphaerales bacterium]|nr:carboxypeptidase-like regulatory domain-containing protein [Phycisphaerales bacterium]
MPRLLPTLARFGFILLLLAPSSATGQTYQGGVRGLIKDPNGVIPGAEITLTNEDTNATRSTTSNGVGEYSFANVLPATYSLKVAMPGFKTLERKGLRVGTQQFLTSDFTMEVGAIAEEVTVTGESPLIERSNAAIAASLDSKQLETLPIFGRNAFYMAISTPNVIQSGDPQFVRYQDQTNASYLSLGGGPRRGNGYLLEGVPITDFTNRPTIVPSMEAIEDLKVQVKTYDADMGHSAGGVFNTAAKSGSNAWHGSALFMNKPGWGTGQLFF